jgi:predicted amidohydrolase YtcJ
MYKIFFNGIIHTIDENNTIVDAVLIADNRIVFTGRESDINLPQHLLKKINLNGLNVYPGFIDCHTHVASVALKKERIYLDDCSTMSEALTLVASYVKFVTPGEWVLGGGWNANQWSDGKPHREHLDRITNKHPVALYNKDGHTQWLNSKAIEICRFDQKINIINGGKLGRDANGELNGLVYEKACDIVNEYSENVHFEQLQRCMEKLYPDLFSLGITSVHSCESFDIWRIFCQLAQKQKLKLRICMHPPVEEGDRLINTGLYSGYGNEWLRMGGLKYFVDGSLGSQTAELFDNYQDLDHSGIEVFTESSLQNHLLNTAEQGLSATIHAIGDKANFKALNALEQIFFISQSKGLRHRIEHAQILRDEDLARFSDLNIIASMQPLHIADDVKIAEKYLGKRAKNTYRINSLIRNKTRVVFGSDMPIADPDPILGIRAAQYRRFKLKREEPKWYENECITASEALKAYTRDAAYASYEENLKGTLQTGKLADFIAVNRDLENDNEEKLEDATVKMTVRGGEVVYNTQS